MRAPATPAAELAAARSATSFTQINHPTTFPSNIPAFAALCRGCPWDYSAADTQYANVDAIEIQNGAGQLRRRRRTRSRRRRSTSTRDCLRRATTSRPLDRATPTRPAPPRPPRRRSAGARPRFSRRSCPGRRSPRESARTTPTSSSSAPAAPTYGSPLDPAGARRTLGDSLAGPALELRVRVLGAGPGAARPGTYELQIHRNGNPIDTRTVSGDDFTAPFTYTASGRYSVLILRKELPQDRLEVYSTRSGSRAASPRTASPSAASPATAAQARHCSGSGSRAPGASSSSAKG